MSAQTAALRELLEQRFPDAIPLTHRTTPQLETGWPELDRVLPRRGLPRGRLTACTPGGGATAVLGEACRRVAERGEGAAWVDGGGTLTALGWSDAPLLLRPADRSGALATTEELLRSGGWGLVVLAGVRVEDNEAVRLGRAAREGGSAFVLLEKCGATAALRLACRFGPGDVAWKRDAFAEPADIEKVVVHVHATSMGWSADTKLDMGVLQYEHRLSVESELADRAGIKRSAGVRKCESAKVLRHGEGRGQKGRRLRRVG